MLSQASRYTDEYLKELKKIKADALILEMRLRIAMLLSSDEQKIFDTFNDIISKEIWEIEFVLELAKLLDGK